MAGRLAQLEQQLEAYRGEQANLLANIGAAVSHVAQVRLVGTRWWWCAQPTSCCPSFLDRNSRYLVVQGAHGVSARSNGLSTPEAQVAALSTLAEARSYGTPLFRAAHPYPRLLLLLLPSIALKQRSPATRQPKQNMQLRCWRTARMRCGGWRAWCTRQSCSHWRCARALLCRTAVRTAISCTAVGAWPAAVGCAVLRHSGWI